MQKTIIGIVLGIVILFIGLYMIAKISNVADLSSDANFNTTFSNLVTNTNTIYDILILVLIVVGLSVAVAYLSGFVRTSTTTSAV